MTHRINLQKVAWRIVDGEAVLLHADTSAYYGLNRTGTLLWNALAEDGVASDRLPAWAGAWFPDAPPGIAGDVAAFLSQLEAFDLLEAASAGDDPKAATTHPSTATPAGPYQAPEVTPFGELEKLILSGE